MADFLIYNKPDNEYYKRGDIVEIQPDGYFNKVGYDEKAFILIEIPEVEYKNVKDYHNSYCEFINDEWETIFLKRFNIDISNIKDSTKTQMNRLKLTDKTWQQQPI